MVIPKPNPEVFGTVNIDRVMQAVSTGVASLDTFFQVITQNRGPEGNDWLWVKKHETPEGVIGAVTSSNIHAGYLRWTALEIMQGLGIDVQWIAYPSEEEWVQEVESWPYFERQYIYGNP